MGTLLARWSIKERNVNQVVWYHFRFNRKKKLEHLLKCLFDDGR